MKRIIKIIFVLGALFVIVSLISGLLKREVWVLTSGITLLYMGVSIALLSMLFWHSKDMPTSHHLSWIGIGLGLFLFTIGNVFRLKLAGVQGVSTDVFITTDYFIIAAYAFLTAGYYFFMSRAGNVIDEMDKLKIIWGVGIFVILVFDLYITMQATEIFGKTTIGLLVNLYYVSLDLIMVLIGITLFYAFYDGEIALFFRLISLSILVWSIGDIIFVLRGSYTENTSFFLGWLKILSIYILVVAQKVYAEIFSD